MKTQPASKAARMASIHAFVAQMEGASAVPGLSVRDVTEGTVGMEWGGHSITDQTDARLLDTALHARVKHWLDANAAGQLGKKEMKERCKAAGARISGNNKVLALRLALQHLPAAVGGTQVQQGSPAAAAGAASAKRKAAFAATAEKAKKAKKKKKKPAAQEKSSFPADFEGCKTCGAGDHQRCTKHKCPQHPNYVAPKPRRRDRSDSYECPF